MSERFQSEYPQQGTSMWSTRRSKHKHASPVLEVLRLLWKWGPLRCSFIPKAQAMEGALKLGVWQWVLRTHFNGVSVQFNNAPVLWPSAVPPFLTRQYVQGPTWSPKAPVTSLSWLFFSILFLNAEKVLLQASTQSLYSQSLFLKHLSTP